MSCLQSSDPSGKHLTPGLFQRVDCKCAEKTLTEVPYSTIRRLKLSFHGITDAPKSQWPPVGWDAYYGKRNRICSRGYNCYTTTCTCGPSQLLVTGTPHILKEFSDGHGDHRSAPCNTPSAQCLAPSSMTVWKWGNVQGLQPSSRTDELLSEQTSTTHMSIAV